MVRSHEEVPGLAPEAHHDIESDRRVLLAARLEALRSAVVEGKGTTDVATRQAAFSGQPLQELLDLYLRKVRSASYQLIDADVERLRSAGVGEDAIFELTVAAALGAAERGLRAGLLALGETEGG